MIVPSQWSGLDPLPGHGPIDVLVNLNQNLYNVNFETHGWAVGSLALVLVHLLAGRWTATDRRLGALAVAVVAAYSCYWFAGGPDFGARYWFLVLFPCLWWTARGAATLAEVAPGKSSTTHATSRDAWTAVRSAAKADDLVCVTGSVFLAGELRAVMCGPQE